jgi:hypothetical protein
LDATFLEFRKVRAKVAALSTPTEAIISVVSLGFPPPPGFLPPPKGF